MYKRILVAVDGSETSRRGLDEAIRLAKSTGGALRLVHVVHDLISPSFGAPGYYENMIGALREAGTKVLEEAAARVRAAEVEYEQTLLESFAGRPADLIVKEAQAWPAEVIVLGTHGRRGLKRLALGSDAELVVRLSPVPVLLVRDQPEAS